MKWQQLGSVLLAAALVTIGSSGSSIAQVETAPSSSPTKPAASSADFWVPVARITPDKDAKIQIINQTGEVLEYLITTHTDFRDLAPGQSATLTSLEFPVFININYKRDSDNVDYSVSVDQKTNTLTVKVTPTTGQGDRTLNVDQTGGVYLY